MKFKILKVAIVSIFLSVSSFASATLIPFGIQTDIDTSTLTNNGWSLNFQSSWGSQDAHDYEMFAGIALDEYVFIGALDIGTNNIALGSAVLYSDLLNFDLTIFGAVAKVAAVMKVPNTSKKCATAVIPKTTKEPKYRENMMHHIHAKICMIRCLKAKSGIFLKGFHSASITPLYI